MLYREARIKRSRVKKEKRELRKYV